MTSQKQYFEFLGETITICAVEYFVVDSKVYIKHSFKELRHGSILTKSEPDRVQHDECLSSWVSTFKTDDNVYFVIALGAVRIISNIELLGRVEQC